VHPAKSRGKQHASRLDDDSASGSLRARELNVWRANINDYISVRVQSVMSRNCGSAGKRDQMVRRKRGQVKPMKRINAFDARSIVAAFCV
jgi:hypothetical protein